MMASNFQQVYQSVFLQKCPAKIIPPTPRRKKKIAALKRCEHPTYPKDKTLQSTAAVLQNETSLPTSTQHSTIPRINTEWAGVTSESSRPT